MPTTYAHYRFGKEVTEALPRGLQNTIEYHRDLYDIGLHGPDILFYYKALKSSECDLKGRRSDCGKSVHLWCDLSLCTGQ